MHLFLEYYNTGQIMDLRSRGPKAGQAKINLPYMHRGVYYDTRVLDESFPAMNCYENLEAREGNVVRQTWQGYLR